MEANKEFSMDYIVIQQPMIGDLHLKGYDLMIFALIWSMTKDDAHRFKANTTAIAERWFGDAGKERTVRDSLNALTEAGFLNKYPGAMPRSWEYDTNYLQILSDVRAGKPAPTVGRKMRGMKVPGIIPETRLPGIIPETPGIIPETPGIIPESNYINIKNINKYYSFAHAQARAIPVGSAQEEEEIYKLFFFKNAAQPRKEVEAFYRYNTKLGWVDKKGHRFDTAEKRLALAEDWEFSSGAKRCNPDYLQAIMIIYVEAAKKGIVAPLVEKSDMTLSDAAAKITTSEEAAAWIEAHLDICSAPITKVAAGRRINYQLI